MTNASRIQDGHVVAVVRLDDLSKAVELTRALVGRRGDVGGVHVHESQSGTGDHDGARRGGRFRVHWRRNGARCRDGPDCHSGRSGIYRHPVVPAGDHSDVPSLQHSDGHRRVHADRDSERVGIRGRFHQGSSGQSRRSEVFQGRACAVPAYQADSVRRGHARQCGRLHQSWRRGGCAWKRAGRSEELSKPAIGRRSQLAPNLSSSQLRTAKAL